MSLSRLGEPYLQYYLSGLSDTDRERRAHAIPVLGVLKDKRAVPALMKSLGSSVPWESGFAADSIHAITGIQTTIILQTTKKPHGGITTTGKLRPSGEIKKDCEA